MTDNFPVKIVSSPAHQAIQSNLTKGVTLWLNTSLPNPRALQPSSVTDAHRYRDTDFQPEGHSATLIVSIIEPFTVTVTTLSTTSTSETVTIYIHINLTWILLFSLF